MTVTRRATENVNTTWIPLPEIPLATFVLAAPELRFSETYGNWNVSFGLALHPDDRARFLPKRDLPPNTQQSDRAFHSAGLSFGFFKDGVYQMPKLVEFMSACFGVEGGDEFREWMSNGGGSPRPLDRDDDKGEIVLINSWLRWMEGLEVYGRIRHEPDRQTIGLMRARFSTPLPLGSLPGQPQEEYQQIGLSKFHSMRDETEQFDREYDKLLATRTGKLPTAPKSTPPHAQATIPEGAEFDATGRPLDGQGGVGVSADDEEDPPF